MPDSIASLPPVSATTWQPSDLDGAPDTAEISFRDLWQDRDKGMTFGDFLDIINPLQHIPVISTIYRLVTGDKISQGARLIGGALYGGPTGFLANGIMSAFEEASGNSPEGHMLALLGGDEKAADPPPAAAPQLAAVTAAVTAAAPVAASIAAQTAPEAGGGKPASRETPTPFAAGPGAAAPDLPARPAGIVRDAPPAPVPPRIKPGPAPREPGHAAAEQPARNETIAADRKRIAESVARAQRAQAALLLASLAETPAESSKAGKAEDDDKKNDAGAAAQAPAPKLPAVSDPFRPHPFMLPPGAPPEMVARAMERALGKYRETLQAR